MVDRETAIIKSVPEPHLRCWVDAELELGLLAVVHGQPLHQQRGEAGAGAAAERVEDKEPLGGKIDTDLPYSNAHLIEASSNSTHLEASAVVCQLADPVQHQVDDLLADGVVPASVVVRRVLLAGHQLLGVEQLAVGASPG